MQSRCRCRWRRKRFAGKLAKTIVSSWNVIGNALGQTTHSHIPVRWPASKIIHASALLVLGNASVVVKVACTPRLCPTSCQAFLGAV